MRSISPLALTTLAQSMGVEAVNIVDVYWAPGVVISYTDKSVPGITGKIIELSNLENVVNFVKSSSSQSITVILDDADGSLKDILNNVDIHKRPVQVYQWFYNIPYADRFLIFEGEIHSPIVWKEGDRTLSFEVISHIEDLEIGFSPEEGSFAYIPNSLVGKAWPLPFGTVCKVPGLQVDPIPSGALANGTGIHDKQLDRQISKDLANAQELENLATLMIIGGLQAGNSFDETGDSSWKDLQKQYQDQANTYLAQAGTARKEANDLAQQRYKQTQKEAKSLKVLYNNTFPPGQLSFLLEGGNFSGQINNGTFEIASAETPEGFRANSETLSETWDSVLSGPQVLQPGNFFWVNPGVGLSMTTPCPVRFIASMLPVAIIGVFAYRNFNNTKLLMSVPPNYYNTTVVPFGSIAATIVTLVRPLTSYNQGWEDALYFDMVSPVGPNTVDVLMWMIQNYTNHRIDAASFNLVRSQLAPFPSNFCLFDRKNVTTALEEIAFQARCAIYLKDNVFYLIYLPATPAPVDTITETDVIAQSMQVTGTPTEDIVTKLVAQFQVNYLTSTKDLIVLRNNIWKYGLHSQSYDWYIYNNPALVDLAATFWLIRKSNTWKMLTVQLPLTKLALETFDAVVLGFTAKYVSNSPVIGNIEKTTYNSKDNDIELEIWLPIRLGEMTQYPFAWPIDSTILIYPTPDYVPGPGSSATGDLSPQNGSTDPNVKATIRPHADRGHPNPGSDNVDVSVTANYLPQNVDSPGAPQFSYNFKTITASPFTAEKIAGTWPAQVEDQVEGSKYQLLLYNKGLDSDPSKVHGTEVDDNAGVIDPDTWVMATRVVWTDSRNRVQQKVYFHAVPGAASSIPGKVKSGSGTTYQVDIYEKGIPKGKTKTVTVNQLDIDGGETIPANSWTLVSKIQTQDSQGQPKTEYNMQFPIWLE